MRCHVDLSQDPLRVQPFLSKAEHFPPNSVMLELFIQEESFFFPNVFIEHVAFFGEVFEAMKKLTFTSELFCPQKAFFGFRNSMRQGCQAMGKNERCEKYKVFKMLAVSKTVSWVFRYGKQMKAVNS